MNKYLKGYLASIPRSEYESMIRFLKDNITDKLSLSEEQFQLILSQITEEHQPATEGRQAQYDEKPSDTYNDFFGNVYIDLNYLFKIIDLLYNAVDGFASLSSSYLSDIKAEIDKLEIMVKEIEAKESYGSNSVVVTETFKDTEMFEKYNDSTSYLFCDRNGEILPVVDIVHYDTSDYIMLKATKDIDLIHASDGRPLGKIDIVDYRGVPTATYSIAENAIDNSPASFWDCSVISDEPIDIPMDSFEAGGAYIKFKVMLPAVYEITEIALTPYCIHPIEVCSIKIGDTPVLTIPEISADTISVRSAKVASDEITFVLRQKNYTFTTEITNEKIDEAVELWNRVLNKTKQVYVDIDSNISTENELYRYYMDKKEKQVNMWNENIIKDREIGG